LHLLGSYYLFVFTHILSKITPPYGGDPRLVKRYSYIVLLLILRIVVKGYITDLGIRATE
jgi:hypothetical protein